MEKNGLVTREPSKEDARLKQITLTKKANDSFENFEKKSVETEKKMIEGISQEELNIFFNVLEKIKSKLKIKFKKINREVSMIKKLMKSIRQYKLPSILSPVFVALEVVMEVLIPYYMADLLDKGVNAGNMPEIYKYGIMLVVFAILSLVFGALAGGAERKGGFRLCGKSAP